MNRRKCTTALTALVAIAVPSTTSLAASTYSLETSQPTYTAAASTIVSVDVYLHENIPSGESSSLTAAGGLFSGAFRVSLASPAATDTTVLSLTAGPGFDGTFVSTFAGSTASLYEDRATALPPGVLPDANHLIKLGTVTFLAGSANTAVVFSLTDFDPSPSSTDLLMVDGNAIDAVLAPASFTLTITPEPTCAFLAAPLLLRRRKRNV